MKLFLLVTSVAVGLAWAVVVDDKEWENFKQKYGKVYIGEEDAMRRKIYTKNKERIEAQNEKYRQGLSSYGLGITQFADLERSEMSKYMGYKRTAARRTDNIHAITDEPLPKSVDWRSKGVVTRVKYQRWCGSCYIFGATGAMESQLAIKTKKLVEYSEQQSLDCSEILGTFGCNGGSPDVVMSYAISYGLEQEKDYPYIGLSGVCGYNHTNSVGFITEYHNIETGDEASLQHAVANVGPVTVGIAVTEDFQHYNGTGIFDDPHCANDMVSLDHAVLVVGYDYSHKDQKPYWIVKNSWSTRWGDKGYVRMARNKDNQCGIATDALYPIV